MKTLLLPTESPEEQLDLLTTVFNTAPVCILVYEALRDKTGAVVDFRIGRLNQQAVEAAGLPEATLRGNTLLTLEPELRYSDFFADFLTVLGTGTLRRSTYQLRTFSGWFDVSISRRSANELVAVLIDVSSHKQAELAVEQQAHLFRTTLDASISSIMYMTAIRDDRGQIIDFLMEMANQAVLQSNFMTPEQVMGKRLLDVFPGNRDNGFFDMYIRVIATGQPERSTQYYRDEFGLEGWFDVSANRQGADSVVVTYMNITESKRNERELQRSNDNLQSILDSAPTAIMFMQPVRDGDAIVDFEWVSVNQKTRDITGLSTEQLIGHRLLDVHPHNREAGLFDRYVTVMETGQMQQFEYQYSADGVDGWFDITAVKREDGLTLTILETTERKRAELQVMQQTEELRRSNEVLQRSNDNLQSFAYIASHDLQEPLRKIRTFGDMLQQHYSGQLGEGRDWIDRMQMAAERMQTLIKDLLAYSRLATRQQSFAPVDLDQLATDVLGDLETVVREQQAVLEIGRLGEVVGDASQLRQLLQNLLSNALKFARPGDRPHIRLTCRPVPAEQLPPGLALRNRAFHLFSVADNGVGFDAERYRDKIFQAFQRLHTRHDYAGTGIGLAIVKRVVENHGGEIIVDSREGNGAEFRVYLPA